MVKKGFTLVELSIVLVIIGLLIGGILVGQSLINSAKVNRVVSDLRQYEVAVQQFYSKFKSYPGDSKAFTPAGNANGYLDNSGGCIGTYSASENTQSWAHLSQASMLKKTYPAYSPSGTCGGIHNPNYRSQNNVNLLFPYTETTKQVSYDGTTGKQAITMFKYEGGNFVINFSVDPLDTIAIESKLSASAIPYPYKQSGVTNSSGTLGMCFDAATEGYIACTNSIAQASNLIYVLGQQ